MPVTNNTLIIGKPKSGKTTFLAQLYLRVRKRKGQITLWKAPANIKVIEDAIARLSAGEEPQSTPLQSNEEMVLPIAIDNQQSELICPDYGGEQVSHMVELMEYQEKWRQRVQQSDHWLLFLRPGAVVNYYDLSNGGHEKLQTMRSNGQLKSPLSEQCHMIELLQALLYLRNIGTRQRISSPSLMVVLTCWDELTDPAIPQKYLRENLPLMHDFIEASWHLSSWKICGLSAQEFPLHDDPAKERYRQELPESFGYYIAHDGTKHKDITLLLKEVML
ncbi:TRAFAC clade GTPase domain-containing protein [Chitinophaga sp. 22620]|uniref:TRAFAC clade GTPase domain-containing protein n=1 Tax=Chitinophaga sp. 22620 TaxID=3453952 RepID=UPI003F82C427